ncbi:MAG: PilN domain-containing protein [Planctomycetota bacterium]
MAENMSFLPEDYLDKKIARRTNVIFISLFAVVLAAVVAADFVGRQQDAQQLQELADRHAEFENVRRQFEQIEALKAEEKRMKQMANVTATLKDNVLKSMVFAELINNMPPTLRLTDLELQTKAVADGAPPPRNAIQREKLRQQATGTEEVHIVPTVVEIDLVGLAPTDVDISEYLGNLNGHPLFGAVSLSYVEEAKKDEAVMRKFRMELALSRDFDPTVFEPTRAGRGLEVDPMGETLQINPEGEMVRPTETLGAVETN